MDSLPAPPPYVYAANDERPRGAREKELCDKAGSTDYLYIASGMAATGLALWADRGPLKYVDQPGVRLFGPAFLGLSFGFTLGGGYLALPKCDDYVQSPPPEGDIRTSWHLAVALAMVSGVATPFFDYFFLGPIPMEWSILERQARIATGVLSGAAGALLPYLLPPKTWRAAKELEHIRTRVDGSGGFIGYEVRF